MIDTINGLGVSSYNAHVQVNSVCVYNKVLTLKEIQTIYNARTMYIESMIKPENIIVYYPLFDIANCEPGNGKLFKDFSGNNINGTGNDGPNNTGLIGKAGEILSFPE